ncbi:MAG: phosphatidate cytidylyltransferase [Acidobacteria bacterium]|nr:phosphatidate cytidylyltransferase [Acidobacteriota bacterium]
MFLRILTALILIPAALAFAVYASPLVLLIGLGVLGTLCLYEYFQLVRLMDQKPLEWFGYPAFWALLVLLEIRFLPPVALFAAALMAALLAAMWPKDSMRERTLGIMATMFGVSYLALPLHAALRIRFDYGEAVGRKWMVVLLAAVWAGDTAAMFAGKAFGRTPFSSRISPRKTCEGAVAGLLGSLAAAAALQRLLFPGLPVAHVIAAAGLAGAFGQLGDLAESLLKRAAGRKDSSNLVPGHGGALDRVDSLLFAFPVLYLYLHFYYSN